MVFLLSLPTIGVFIERMMLEFMESPPRPVLQRHLPREHRKPPPQLPSCQVPSTPVQRTARYPSCSSSGNYRTACRILQRVPETAIVVALRVQNVGPGITQTTILNHELGALVGAFDTALLLLDGGGSYVSRSSMGQQGYPSYPTPCSQHEYWQYGSGASIHQLPSLPHRRLKMRV